MAFINKYGVKVSYNCQELINELQEDIEEFGGDLLLDVVTEVKEGVTIYKDYNFIDGDNATKFILSDNEELQRMTASALLLLYQKENSIF